MKKTYLMGLAFMFAINAQAQTNLRFKSPMKNETGSNMKTGNPISTQQVAGNVVCNTQYLAGSTMNLQFTFTSNNTDGEYIDNLQMTFPAGITPNTAGTSNPFPNTEDAGGGLEALNSITGQVVSWGNAASLDEYGGIFSSTGINFTVNVTIGSGVTGNQSVNFVLDGDGFDGAPGVVTPGVGTTASGSFQLFPVGAVINDVKTIANGVLITPTVVANFNNCMLATHTIVTQIANVGTSTLTNVPINYSINGIASTLGSYPGPLKPGDTVLVLYPTTYNFSAAGSYKIKTWTALVGDVSLANDTAISTINNSLPIALTTNTYVNGIETTADFNSITQDWVGSGLAFGISNGTVHSGPVALYYTLSGANPAGTYATMNILPCMDVTNGDTYRISYWKKANTSGTLTVNGMSGIFTGLSNAATAMTTVLKPYAAIVPNAQAGVWAKDSVDYVATATETRYFAIGGKATISGTSTMGNVRIDDIKIAKLPIVTDIKNNTALETISLFPNPTTGILNVSSNDATTIEIYNVIGEKVYSNKNLSKGNNIIDLSLLINGSYFVKLNAQNNTSVKKIVVAK